MRILVLALPLLAAAPRAQDFDARVDALLARLAEADAREACDELARLGPRAVPRIAALLFGPDVLAAQHYRVRHAAYVLGRMRAAAVDALPALLAVTEETDGELEQEALWAVGEIVPWADQAARAMVGERVGVRGRIARANRFLAGIAAARADLGANVPLERLKSLVEAPTPPAHLVIAAARTVAQGLAADPEASALALVPLLQDVADPRDADVARALLCGRALEPTALDLADAITVALPAAPPRIARHAHALALFDWDAERIAHALRMLAGSPLEEGIALTIAWRAASGDAAVAAACCRALAGGGPHALLGLPALRRVQQHGVPAVAQAAGDAMQHLLETLPHAREAWESFAACTYGGGDLDAHADVLRRCLRPWVTLAQGAFIIGDYVEHLLDPALLTHLDLSRTDAFATALGLLPVGEEAFSRALIAHLERPETAVPLGERPAELLLAALEGGDPHAIARVLERMLLPADAADAALAAAGTHWFLPLRARAYARLAAQPRRDLGDDLAAALRDDLLDPDRGWRRRGWGHTWPTAHARAFRLLAATVSIRHATKDRELAARYVARHMQEDPSLAAAVEGVEPYGDGWNERVVKAALAVLR